MLQMTRLPEKLRILRGNRPLEDAAAAIGISAASLAAYEDGFRTPCDDIKQRISAFYGVGLSELFLPKFTHSHAPEFLLAIEIWERTANLSVEQKCDFMNILKVLFTPDGADHIVFGAKEDLV